MKAKTPPWAFPGADPTNRFDERGDADVRHVKSCNRPDRFTQVGATLAGRFGSV